MPASYEDQLRLAREASLLRFKTMMPLKGQRTWLSWAAVGKFFDVRVRHLKALVNWLMEKNSTSILSITSKLRSRKAKPIILKKPRRKLTQEKMDYLGSEDTLRSWQGKSLEERTALFNSRYAPLKISVTTLRSAYRKLNVKKKKVREIKIIPERTKERIPRQIRFARDALRKALEEGKNIVWLDEAMFTRKTWDEQEWSAKKKNFQVS